MGISTEFTFTTEELILDHFIKGSCPNVENISSFGHETSIGYFTNAENVIGFPTGIIISTGDIRDAHGPNESKETTSGFNDISGDKDLEIFATNQVLDAAGIEFDFVPFTDQVEFVYAFASEEYCEFVGSIFNDNFGFFVSGPGINGDFFDNAINVATLSSSGDYVSINTVNYSNNSGNYVKNELEADADLCGITFDAGYLDLIEYDGFTIPLKARIDVIPCKTYHIRLVVGDVGDDKLDSAVFLASKSFDLGGEVIVTAKSEGSDESVAYEGCRNGAFVFTRGNNTNVNEPLEVNFTVSPLSDAVVNEDYLPFPNTITIPANETSIVLPVEIIDDAVSEIPEKLRLEIEYDCDCFPSTQSDLIIQDIEPLEGTFEEIFVCPDQEFAIGPTVTGGAAPYNFIWNTGASTQNLSEVVDEPTHYTVTISDDCGNTTLAIAGVGIQESPTATLSGTTQICEGENAFLSVELEGFAPWSIVYTIDGVEQQTINDIYNNPFALEIGTVGEYVLMEFYDANCDGIAEGIGEVNSGGVLLDYSVSSPSCPALANGNITVTITEGNPPYQIEWSNGTEESLTLQNLQAGTYTISITDANNCLISQSIEIEEPLEYDEDCITSLVYIPNAFSPNEDGVNDDFTIYIPANDFIQNIKKVQVFNRWGAVVYESLNIAPTEMISLWDGIFEGKKMNSGVFVWLVELELADGSQQLISGDVTLVK